MDRCCKIGRVWMTIIMLEELPAQSVLVYCFQSIDGPSEVQLGRSPKLEWYTRIQNVPDYFIILSVKVSLAIQCFVWPQKQLLIVFPSSFLSEIDRGIHLTIVGYQRDNRWSHMVTNKCRLRMDEIEKVRLYFELIGWVQPADVKNGSKIVS